MNFLEVESESECWGKEKSFGEFNEKMQEIDLSKYGGMIKTDKFPKMTKKSKPIPKKQIDLSSIFESNSSK